MFPNQPEQTPSPTPTPNPFGGPPQTPPPAPVQQPAQWPAQTPPQGQPQWSTPSPTPAPIGLPGDYLNQIAPQAPKSSMFKFGLKQIIIIGIALVVLASILAGVLNATTNGNKEPLERLSVRLTETEKIATDAQANLKSSKLRSLNSNLKLYLTNTNRDIAAPLLTANINTKKISKSVTAKESTELLAGRLEDARLNAVFDRTYAREMAYQLGTTMTLMTEIYNSTQSASLKTFLKSSYDSLKPTQESFASFNVTE